MDQKLDKNGSKTDQNLVKNLTKNGSKNESKNWSKKDQSLAENGSNFVKNESMFGQKCIKIWWTMDQTFILDSQRAADVMITSISASFNACATAASPNVA